MGNSPRDCGPGGQWLGFIFIWWGIVLMGNCPRPVYLCLLACVCLSFSLPVCVYMSARLYFY